MITFTYIPAYLINHYNHSTSLSRTSPVLKSLHPRYGEPSTKTRSFLGHNHFERSQTKGKSNFTRSASRARIGTPLTQTWRTRDTKILGCVAETDFETRLLAWAMGRKRFSFYMYKLFFYRKWISPSCDGVTWFTMESTTILVLVLAIMSQIIIIIELKTWPSHWLTQDPNLE